MKLICIRLLGNTSSYGTRTITTFYKEGQLWLNLTTFQIGQTSCFPFILFQEAVPFFGQEHNKKSFGQMFKA